MSEIFTDKETGRTGIKFANQEDFNKFNSGKFVKSLYKKSSDNPNNTADTPSQKSGQSTSSSSEGMGGLVDKIEAREKQKQKIQKLREQKRKKLLQDTDAKLKGWGYERAIDLPTDKVDKILELAAIVSPNADLTYLSKSMLGRKRFLQNLFKGKPHVVQDKSGKQYRQDRKLEEEAKAVKYDTDIGFSRLQVALQNNRRWKKAGFYSYLCLMYANVENLYPTTEELIMKGSLAYLDLKKTNTCKIGLFNDKGLTGYTNAKSYDQKSVENMAYILGLNEVSWQKWVQNFTENMLHDSINGRSEICGFPNMFIDFNTIHDYLAVFKARNRAHANFSDIVGLGDNRGVISRNFTHISQGDRRAKVADETAMVTRRVGESYDSSHIQLSLYNYKGVIFTTSRYIKMSCIDALQVNNTLSLPCIDIIKTILNNLLLSRDDISYCKLGNSIQYTSIFPNNTDEADSTPVLIYNRLDGLYFHIKANLYPFYSIQKGTSSTSYIEVKFIDLDEIDVLEKKQYLDKISKNPDYLPLGKVTPLLLLQKTSDDNVNARVLSLEEQDSYEITNDLYILEYIRNFINTDNLAIESEGEFSVPNAYSEITKFIYNFISSTLVNKVGIELEPLIATNLDELNTANLTTPNVTEINTTQTTYRCPISINYDGEFVL